MIRTNARQGSILVTLLIVGAFLTVMGALIMPTNSVLYELARDRALMHAHFRAAQALVQYGIALCVHGQVVPGYSQRIFSSWPLPDGQYEGVLEIERGDRTYQIKAIIRQNKEEKYRTHAELTQHKDGLHCTRLSE